MERERTLEVRPRGQRVALPVRDDAVALERIAAPAWEAEAILDDDVRGRERRIDIAVRKRPLGDERVALGCRDGVDQRVERLPVDDDQLDCVLRDVAVTGDDHNSWFTVITC